MQQIFQQAIHLHQTGHLAQAEQLYLQLLAKQPNNPQILHMLGLAAYQRGDLDKAILEISRAIEANPRQADYYSNLGLVLRAAGQAEKAVETYQKALSLSPRDAEIHNNLGGAFHALGRLGDAATAFSKSLSIKPNYPLAQFNLGNVLFDQGQFADAAGYFGKALQHWPEDADVQNNLGNALRNLGRFKEAAECYRHTLRIQPGYPSANRHLGWLLQELGQTAEAIQFYRASLAQDPADASAFYNLANALRETGQLEEAITCYRNALALSPQDPDTLNNLGNALREAGKIDEAIACYREALKLNPEMHHTLAHLLHQCQQICDWGNLDEMVREIRKLVHEKPEAQIAPFVLLSLPGVTPAEQLRCSQNWVNNQYEKFSSLASKLGFNFKRTDRTKIRLGYLSADFHEHATAYLMAEIFELHDREHFEVVAYSYGPDDGSPMRARLDNAFDRFEDVRTATDEEVAHKIFADGIDILIDLKGYTAHTRSQILAMRPAPLQVNYLGYPGTMGADFIDYLIGDPVVTPTSHEDAYAEKLALMPYCYQPNDRQRPLKEKPSRTACGLPEHGFVFCGFNQNFKILPQTFDIWMRLLREVPESVLWLLESSPTAMDHLKREAEARGVNPARLIFAPRLPLPDHLARQQQADLLLDTLPYNAHTTASDALWAGVPVLTCMGETFASRVAASLIQAVGLQELVVSSLEDYFATALRLATDDEECRHLRARLVSSRATAPLFDAINFTKALEKLYVEMRHNWQQGLPPAHIR